MSTRSTHQTLADQRDAARERLAGNPFYVLELRPDCGRAEVERAGQKLIGMLELELDGAKNYRSPLGLHRRTPELVREAMAELRDPNRRLLHELWASLEPSATSLGAGAGAGAGAGDDDDDNDGDDDGDDAEERAPFAALGLLGFGDWSSGSGS